MKFPWPRKRKLETYTPPSASVGVRNDSDAEYRARRQDELGEMVNCEKRQEFLNFFDKWVIDKWESSDGRDFYLPYPLWDEEAPLTRESFDTWDQALEYIESVGGIQHPDLFESRPNPLDNE